MSATKAEYIATLEAKMIAVWIRKFISRLDPFTNALPKGKLTQHARSMRLHLASSFITPGIGFMRPFGCPVTILNTLDSLGKFKGKVDEGFLLGYSVNSKAFRVFNSRIRIVQETLHVNFLENKPNLAEEFVNDPIVSETTVKKPVVETSDVKASEDKPQFLRNNLGPQIIKDWITDSEDEAESRPKIEKKTVKPSFAKIKFVKSKEQGNPQQDFQEKGVIDSRCSRHMTWNISYLTDYEEIDGGYVAFGSNPKRGKITSKGTIRTGKLDFKNVYFVKELKFNLFSVSQMCDKKNSVLFTDTECIVLSPNFTLTDKSHVLHKVPRKNNMYSVDLKNIIPKGGLTCLFTKVTSDESKYKC
nr:ribonuclease H-like domain-containing protein [Tanacetum cinerariifolium]